MIENHNIFHVRCSDDTMNKLNNILENSVFSTTTEWFKDLINRENKTIEYDKKHIQDLKLLLQLLDTMLLFQQVYDTDRKRVAKSVEAITSLKSYLIGLGMNEVQENKDDSQI